jgi:lambda repressor-like predicted transcriptional regulator
MIAAHMHPEQIKADLRIAGKSPAAVAKELKVSRTHVSRVIHGTSTSERVARAISTIVRVPVSELWPEKYPDLNQ